jgi:ribosome-associated protein
LRNRELATQRLVAALRDALFVQRRRVATKPSPAAKQRRLDEKKRRGAVKRLRRPADDG